jgi:hypothetical protein
MSDSKPGFLKGPDGISLSMMRLNMLIGIILTALCVLPGIALTIYQALVPTAGTSGLALVGLGVGIYTSGALAKAIQSGAEAKMMAAVQPINPTAGGVGP